MEFGITTVEYGRVQLGYLSADILGLLVVLVNVIWALPAIGMAAGWWALRSRLRLETHPKRALTAMMMTTVAIVPAVVFFAFLLLTINMVALEKVLGTTSKVGLGLSAGAIVAAGFSARCNQTWIPKLTFSISVFMVLLYSIGSFFMMGFHI